MTPLPTAAAAIAAIIIAIVFLTQLPSPYALGGSATTVAVSYGSATTVCSLLAGQPTTQIQCWRNGQFLPSIFPSTVSFDYIAGGLNIVCAVRSGGYSLLCWDIPSLTSKRLYNGSSTTLTSLTIGDNQICALTNGSSGNVNCWRGHSYSTNSHNGSSNFRSISSGLGFSCGVVENINRVVCWGSANTDIIASEIESEFGNISMANIFVGGRHACGMNSSGVVICKGNNNNGQLNVPDHFSYEYNALALGANHTCAIRRLNHTVVCWGGNGEFSSNLIGNISFESIVAGLDFTCGLVTADFSVICWGPGWPNSLYPAGVGLPLQRTLPGPCVRSTCECGIYPESQTLCSGNGNICGPCDVENLLPPASPPTQPPGPLPSPPPLVGPSPPSKGLRRVLLAFAIVGSIGSFAGICTIIYCLWTGVCFGKKKIHNSVQPTITGNNAPQQSNSNPPSRSSTLRRQGSRFMRRQRSGTSSIHAERAEEFLFQDLAAATNNFSLENKIGAGSFGVVYRGKLLDGREVAIKRSETGLRTKKFQEKESAFESELAFLSRLHHKHLVRLVGFCEERDERLLVYDYMKNGENNGAPMSVVDYAVPAIMAGELTKILDPRVGPPELNEAEAVELVAYTAMHCVNLEGKDRPTMTDIVANLARALVLCDDSYGSISSGPISIVSE
ncbi:hypothetical protein ACH5RR_019363 [Cinchona calisaya]|uniref:Protein kinase domain-containing protein n=1 Tax=Cinchona calisaya TaxID=153742 RepID=A0ABD2ZPD8_9GENT